MPSNKRTAEKYETSILTLANQLTILRIVFVPVFVIFLVYNKLGWALLTFVAASLTDLLDGIIARRFGQKTSVGAILDPIADKLLMTSSVVVLSLSQMGFSNTIPLWLLLLIVFRDVFILLGSLAFVLAHGFRTFPPTMWGKWSTGFQLVTVLAVLTYNWINVHENGLYFLFAMTGLFTAISGLNYLSIGRELIEDE